jgi:GNAT superfamily N-acetyltransferase
MKDTLCIREAIFQDAAVLANLTAQLGYHCSPKEILERLIPYQNKSHGVVLVAVLDDKVVGWISLNTVRYFYVKPFIEVSGFVVEEKERNKGIGKRLLRDAEAWTGEQGYKRIRIRTNVLRLEAHRFYENNGYKKVKEQKVYMKEIELKN